MRLFVAIDLPETVKDQVESLCKGISGQRWVKREQMHLTLRFIGEVDSKRAESIKAALSALRFDPFEMALRGVGQFPPRRPPRVLWVGVRGPDALSQLAQGIESALVGIGLDPADKPFKPHITLARIKNKPPRETLQQYFREHENFKTDPFTVDQFVLYASVLAPSGATYHKQGVYRASGSI